MNLLECNAATLFQKVPKLAQGLPVLCNEQPSSMDN